MRIKPRPIFGSHSQQPISSHVGWQSPTEPDADFASCRNRAMTIEETCHLRDRVVVRDEAETLNKMQVWGIYESVFELGFDMDVFVESIPLLFLYSSADFVSAREGAVKLELSCTQVVDPEPGWSFDALLTRLHALEAKLYSSSKILVPFTKGQSR
ncbi:hypothetical protein TorRG33x02_246880 [Trema orientale]|uniref:Uncharacterized protein n=1 Tax=Trema orientale TaxID=63057 RepID=A0A2P5DMY2_TREOI|nr:hypothetical protein TorRG33x02_246880 [Trema orientale]